MLFAPSALEDLQRPSPPVPTNPSIVVLPFLAQGHQDGEYLADGFTDDVISELGRFRSLLVIGRTASSACKSRTTEPAEVGAKLGVKYALQGTLRRINDSLRISVELIGTETGERIWGERYHVPSEEVVCPPAVPGSF